MRHITLALITILTLTVATPRAAAAADLVARYPVGSQPYAIVSDPTDGRLYVANRGTRTAIGGGRVSVIDPTSKAVSWLDTTKPSGHLALDSAARRLYSSNFDATNDSVSLDVIDLTSGDRVRSTEVGGLGLALDTTRSRVLVAGGSYLVAINTTSFDMDVKPAPFSQSWFDVAVDATNGLVFVTNGSGLTPSLHILLASDMQRAGKNISLPGAARYGLAVDESRHRVYVAGSDLTGGDAGTVSVLDVLSVDPVTFIVEFTLRHFPFAGYPEDLVYDAAAHRVWVTETHHNKLVELNDETLAVVSETPLPWQPGLAAFGRDGRLYVSGQSASEVGAFNVADQPANSAPVIDRVVVTPLEATTDQLLTATVDAHDPDGDPFTVTYQWSVGTKVLVGETAPTLDLLKPGNGDRDDRVCLAVTAFDGKDETMVSNCFVQVRDSAPVVTELTLDPATPATSATLRATAVATDVDGDKLEYTFRWSVGNDERRVTTSDSPTDTLDLAIPGNGDAGEVVSVEVFVSDRTLQSARTIATATVANTGPTVSVSVNDVTARKQDALVATVTAGDGDGDALLFTYVWRVDGVVKLTTSGTSATTSELDLRAVAAHIGDVITVNVTVSDGTTTASASAMATVTPAGH